MKKRKMEESGLAKALLMTVQADRMTPAGRQKLAEERLRKLVAYARQNSPYYSNLYKGLPEKWELTDLPPVNKPDLMASFDQWLTDRSVSEEETALFIEDKSNMGKCMNGRYLVFTTSGSTGFPLTVLYDKTCMNISSALSVIRSYARKEDMAAFIKNGKRTASIFAEGFYLGSGSIAYQLRRMPWKKGLMKNLDVRMPITDIVEQLNRFSPVMLGGYPSGLELLAEEQEAGRLHIAPAVTMTGGELLRDDVREKLTKAFGGFVQTNYSCTEGGIMCHECVNRHLHLNEEWIMIEAVDEENHPVPDGTMSAKILLTNLANKVQPFIRYEVTDRIVMHHEACGCGCQAPWLEIEGRRDDILRFEEGMRIQPLAVYAQLKEVPGLKRFQLVQKERNLLELRILAGDPRTVYQKAERILQDFFVTNGVHVTICAGEELPQIHPESGKFKHVVGLK